MLKTTIPANEIFEALLLEHKRLGKSAIDCPRSRLHEAFYITKRAHPEEMGDFEMLLRLTPISPTLTTLIRDYRQAQIIATPDSVNLIEIRNSGILAQPTPEAKQLAREIYDRMYN